MLYPCPLLLGCGLLAFGFGLPGLFPAEGQSAYTTRLDDPRAVYLDGSEFGARGDGVTDDSAAMQAALDKAESTTAHEGILFVPTGRYRLTRTIYVWPGVRVIGYGAERPVFVLGCGDAGIPEGHRRDGDVCRLDSD